MMAKERDAGLPGFCVLTQGSTGQAPHSCAPRTHTLHVQPTSTLHNGDTPLLHTMASVAPGWGWLGNPLSIKCPERQRQVLEAPWRPSSIPWGAHSE